MCIISHWEKSVEVLARGDFEPSKLENHVLFSGQVKAREEQIESYEIPVIGIHPRDLIQLVKKIRTMKNYSNETNMFIASRTDAYVNKEIRNVFDRDDITSETIRCFYAFIAYRLYANPSISEPVYCVKSLVIRGIQMFLQTTIIVYSSLESNLTKNSIR